METYEQKRQQYEKILENIDKIISPLESSTQNEQEQESLQIHTEGYLQIIEAAQSIHDVACRVCEIMPPNEHPNFGEMNLRIRTLREKILNIIAKKSFEPSE